MSLWPKGPGVAEQFERCRAALANHLNRKDTTMSSTPRDFTKKPVTIQAMQWDGTAEGATPIIDWVLTGEHTASYYAQADTVDGTTYISIHTLEGAMLTSPNDWVIRGVKGEFYPCKPDIFEETYDPAKTIEVYRDAAGEWRYRVKAANHEIVESSEGYSSEYNAHRAARDNHPGVTRKVVES